MTRALPRVLITLSLPLTLPALLAGLVLGTERGTRWALDQAQRLSGGALHIGQVRGHLGGDLQLRGVRLRHDGVESTLAELSLAWRPAALLSRSLDIERLRLSGIRAVLPPQGDSAASSRGVFEIPRLPLAIRLAEVRAAPAPRPPRACDNPGGRATRPGTAAVGDATGRD